MTGRFIAYYRVRSTKKQSESGLDLDAQRQAVAAYLGGGGKLPAEFTDVETGKKNDRPEPELLKAIAAAKANKAKLIVANLDRLAAFLLTFVIIKSTLWLCWGRKLTVGIMAVMARTNANRITERSATARGLKLGDVCDP